MDKELKRVDISELMLPKQLLEKYPNCGLTTKQIGYAVHCKSLAGIRLSSEYSYSILESDFIKFLEHIKTVPTLEVIIKS